MSLSQYIHAMGRGPSRGRSLTRAEAADAMRQILAGTAAPESVGALLMLMRYRGETAEEVAGLTDGARDQVAAWHNVPAAVDWPSYAAGRSRGLPWFLLSALLIAKAGRPVLLHGWNSHQGKASDVRTAVEALGIGIVNAPNQAKSALDADGIAYAPLQDMHPDLLRVLRLRDVLGLRSAVNTVCRMLNPSSATATVQGVFHPSYRALQQDAGHLLDQQNLMVIKGGGGEFERHPAKSCILFGLRDGEPFEIAAQPLLQEHRRLATEGADLGHLLSVWTGKASDPWAEAIVTSTSAIALMAADPALDLLKASEQADVLWQSRHLKLVA